MVGVWRSSALLAIVAGAAGVGMGFKLVAFGRLNVTGYVMYPALGWVSVVPKTRSWSVTSAPARSP